MKTVDNSFFTNILKKHNIKSTPQRIGILKYLHNNKSHPSVEMTYRDIKKTFPNISFNTVYTVLMKFAELGIIESVETGGGSKRFDPFLHEHGHFRCIKCGCIEDFSFKGDIGDLIPAGILKRSEKKKVILEGLCKKCSGKS